MTEKRPTADEVKDFEEQGKIPNGVYRDSKGRRFVVKDGEITYGSELNRHRKHSRHSLQMKQQANKKKQKAKRKKRSN